MGVGPPCGQRAVAWHCGRRGRRLGRRCVGRGARCRRRRNHRPVCKRMRRGSSGYGSQRRLLLRRRHGLAGGRGHDGRSRRIGTRQPKSRARGASEREFACVPLLSREAWLRQGDCDGVAAMARPWRRGRGNGTAAAGQSRWGASNSTPATTHRHPTPLPLTLPGITLATTPFAHMALR